MPHRLLRNARIIGVMFWAFPYLLWQAFGHWSGFVVGVMIAVTLTIMLNSILSPGRWRTASPVQRASFQSAEPYTRAAEGEAYQQGYRAQDQPSGTGSHLYRAEELHPQYEEMLVLYPQEETMPSMRQE